MMENITIRRAKLDDLYEIQRLNNELFNIELKNYDDSLKEYWPISKEGEAYFREKRLVKAFTNICMDNNINEIKVVASFKNKLAVNFYKELGFEESEITLKQKI